MYELPSRKEDLAMPDLGMGNQWGVPCHWTRGVMSGGTHQGIRNYILVLVWFNFEGADHFGWDHTPKLLSALKGHAK